MEGEPTLGVVGLSAAEERVYRALLRSRRSSSAELAGELGASPSRLSGVLERLEAKGFVSRIPGRPVRFLAAPAEVAVEAVIRSQLSAFEEARDAARRLAEETRGVAPADASPDVVELVVGSDAVLQRWAQLQQITTDELVAFDRPPYSRPVPGVNVDEEVALKRSVRYRIIYSRAALEWPGMLAHVKRCVAAGEQARVLPDVPMKLDIVDRTLGLVPLTADDPGRTQGALLLHPSPLLDTLAFLFELLWERAIPLAHVLADDQGPDPHLVRHADLLALLAAGLKDETIARQLGVGVRTVQRRVALLMRELGAETRFQAGLQAARQGWGPPVA